MTFRSRAMLDLCEGETCVRCGRAMSSVVGAHYTGVRRLSYGGGIGIKVHDCLVADLCRECHQYMDQLSRDKEGRWGHSEEFQHYILLTIAKRFETGKFRLARKREALSEAAMTQTQET